MAGRVQWRRFGFFDRDTVTENIEGTLVGKSSRPPSPLTFPSLPYHPLPFLHYIN